MGLTCEVLARKGHTNAMNLIKTDEVTLIGVRAVGERINGVGGTIEPFLPDLFAPRPTAPGVVLVVRRFGSGTIVHAEPVIGGDGSKTHTPAMFGGLFIATSDSRFTELVEQLTGHAFHGAIKLHDRVETWEVYDLLTR